MSDFHKKRFEFMSDCDETRYNKEMIKYNDEKKILDEEKKASKKEERKAAQEEKEKEEQKKLEKQRKSDEKKSKKKDPNAPKGARSAYLYFSNEVREKLKSENPEISITECAKEAGKLWKELTPSRRAKFENMAANDKIRYEKETAAYKAGLKTIPDMLNKSMNSLNSSPTKSIQPASSSNGNEESSSSDTSDSDE